MITQLGNDVCEFKDGLFEFYVSLAVANMVTLSGKFGDDELLLQMFTFRGSDPTFYALKDRFQIDEIILNAAQMYRDGVTDKDLFIKEIKRLEKESVLKREDVTLLEKFIKNNNIPPPTVERQLMMMGFGHIVSKINYYSHQPELLKTCEGFRKFLGLLPKFLRECVLAYS